MRKELPCLITLLLLMGQYSCQGFQGFRRPQNVPTVRLYGRRSFDTEEKNERNNEATAQLSKKGGTRFMSSRREWFGMGAAIVTGAAVLSTTSSSSAVEDASKLSTKKASSYPKKIAPFNITKVMSENTINVTLLSTDEIVTGVKTKLSLDRETYTELEERDLPHADWILPIFRPKARIVKTIPNSELLIASLVAGASTEIVRTALLYPLSTIKTRAQARKKSQIKRDVPSLCADFRSQIQEGNLYAGIVPSLLIAVPAAGVYYGVRDVTKRLIKESLTTPTKLDDLVVALFGAIIADVAALIVRTPADALALRLQTVKSGEDKDEVVDNWFQDSIRVLPAVILTDLPYLISKISLNKLVLNGDENIGRYALIYIAIACGCAAITTPFDVARTRILLEKSAQKKAASETSLYNKIIPSNTTLPIKQVDDESNFPVMEDAGEEVLQTMINITRENDGQMENLFTGWLERTIDLGVGRAWLDPIRLIGYLGIRDAVLLEWFN